jgi:hypothetical protein
MKLTLVLSIFLLLLFVLPTYVTGQTLEDQYFQAPKRFLSQFEIAIGPSISSLRGNPGVDNTSQNTRKTKIGYVFAIGAVHEINEKFEVVGRLMYEHKGGKNEHIMTYFDEETQTFMQGQADDNHKYKYYTIPILLRYNAGKKNQLKFAAGPFISLLDKQTRTVIHNYHNRKGQSFWEETEYNTKYDFGISGEISYEIPLNKVVSIDLQLSHILGLKNVRPQMLEPYTMKTNNTSFLIGFVIKR